MPQLYPFILALLLAVQTATGYCANTFPNPSTHPAISPYANPAPPIRSRADIHARLSRLETMLDRLERRSASASPGIIGIMRAGASRAPEKAGTKMTKQQGQNAGSATSAQNAKAADDMYNHAIKNGSPNADKGCIQNLVNTFSVAGGHNSPGTNACFNPDVKQQAQAKKVDAAKVEAFKGTGGASQGMAALSALDRAKKAAYGG